jgi:glyoxylase-like metal-dependent hydrolase (beta-lactamase superfamily II)
VSAGDDGSVGQSPEVEGFFDPETSTISYLVNDPETRRGAVIDPVLDYDPKSGRTATRSADRLAARVEAKGIAVDWILETHVHADHLTAAPYLKDRLGGRVATGARVSLVQQRFASVFNLGAAFAADGSQFDRLFANEEAFAVGGIAARVLSTPGHTPACVTYLIGEAAFVGDTLFMPDYGTARCDFPGGDARELYHSIRRILALPDETRLFMCHDYQPGGRAPAWETTVAAQRAENVHLQVGEEAFVALRSTRDKDLPMPVLLLPAVQVNLRAGALPAADANGIRYLKIPVDLL